MRMLAISFQVFKAQDIFSFLRLDLAYRINLLTRVELIDLVLGHASFHDRLSYFGRHLNNSYKWRFVFDRMQVHRLLPSTWSNKWTIRNTNLKDARQWKKREFNLSWDKTVIRAVCCLYLMAMSINVCCCLFILNSAPHVSKYSITFVCPSWAARCKAVFW